MSATEEPEVPESAPGGSEPVPDEPLHSEAWLIAFEEALKEPRFYERLVLYARGRTGYVRIHHNVDDDYAANLVADIIDDVFEGVLDWNPDRIPLRYFIQREIRSRTRHASERAARRPHDDIDDPRIEDDPHFESSEPSAFETAEVRERTERVMAALRARAANDPEVLQLLDAYEQQLTRRAEVIALTNLSLRQYEAARERLTRMTHHLPPELQPDPED